MIFSLFTYLFIKTYEYTHIHAIHYIARTYDVHGRNPHTSLLSTITSCLNMVQRSGGPRNFIEPGQI
jgi:hypothetical protein